MSVNRIGLFASKHIPKIFYRPQVGLSVASMFSKCYSTSSEDDLLMRVKVEPIKRENESLENKKARLVYQSRKRGILETDLLLSGFAAKYLKDMTPEQLQEYDSLLDELDWDIYYWATKNYETSPLPDKWKGSDLMTKLQKFAENKDKKILRMPDLKEYK
ncbi:related to Succinate dehydrogenase assembly factor 2, mitochondrial [Zygosaccharomyces bailii]|nr:related to Succinate dehydrogenase assembly factor 2, mitochondrial [Zygosaccharomyces bailii]